MKPVIFITIIKFLVKLKNHKSDNDQAAQSSGKNLETQELSKTISIEEEKPKKENINQATQNPSQN